MMVFETDAAVNCGIVIACLLYRTLRAVCVAMSELRSEGGICNFLFDKQLRKLHNIIVAWRHSKSSDRPQFLVLQFLARPSELNRVIVVRSL
jgi:hypothetical protein